MGLLGAGRVAQSIHLPILLSLDGVRLRAIAEVDPEARKHCQKVAPDARLFSNYQELLDAGDVDAAVVCLPPALHADAAIQCFTRGLHVYLEKPIAISMEDGCAVVDAWRQARTVGQIGFNFRFHPGVLNLEAVIRSGDLEQVVALRSTFAGARRELPAWKRGRVSGGGVVLDLVSHQIDLVRFLFERKVTSIESTLRSVTTEDDTVVVQMALGEAPLVSLFASLSAVEEHSIELIGTTGAIRFDRYRDSGSTFFPARRSFSRADRLRQAASQVQSLPAALRRIVLPQPDPSYRSALIAFIASASGETQPFPDMADGLANLNLVFAVEEAARQGRRIVPSSEWRGG